MSDSLFATCDVLIIGAGPVGLFLACELALAGCSVQILEQAGDASTPLKRAPFGLRGLSVATMEIFDRRGLLMPLKARIPEKEIASAASWMRQTRQPAGHFAGIDFFMDQIDQTQWAYRLPPMISPMAADLESIEAVLKDRALALGVVVSYGVCVSEVHATDNDVSVRADEKVFRGDWLVACDGGRSSVRKAAGFGFTGTDPEFTGYFARVDIADPRILPTGHHDTPTGTYLFDPPDMIRMVEFDGGACHRHRAITRDHIQAVLRRISGSEVEVRALGLATTWTDRAFLASDYRKGRVLLAGDAAHIHSPLGGQGLNLGFGDAMNLGWKLASIIRGDAAPALLDSYQNERRPVAAQVLDWSRAQVALMRPNQGSRALRAIVHDLIATQDGATYMAERVWGIGMRYNPGDDHPLMGRSAPNFRLNDETRLNEHLRRGKALLLDFGGSSCLHELAVRYQHRLSYIAVDVNDRLGLCALLIRPDGFVVWARDHPSDCSEAEQALSQWFLSPLHAKADLTTRCPF
ncbi:MULTISPECIES: FAD-dependent monooxygenase [Gluconobacter]|uniref:FAD-dependent oxidoreductase n=1 Tax=Gluconobacter cerinus TaxID=38307 RepID=A0A1B6VG26_9PROT|nr:MULTISPECIES: FAD-dependent monooxygenase [Gluconobacter]MBS1020384.1 FAD-dependent monooxygenase [Gluconobacter cerinus]MBS1036125.1 FAD-dependent monooxygenase [Gluconobacter cerinus]MBS1045547.1 FAD-dependent monooxygenase [Gluconobacter cerinus]MBS1069954.1 FAD-dependent monooxygenase [Gluconobacter cerinus]MBS1073001.1 FAD-dependent monooxygenase [Gluconobacter cerinus]